MRAPHLRVGPFERIPCPDFPVLSDEVLANLSHDHAYLYKMIKAIIDGKNNIVSSLKFFKLKKTVKVIRYSSLQNEVHAGDCGLR